MLRDAGIAHGLRYGILRYFNVAGADPDGRAGQSTPAATHLVKVAAQVALGLRPKLEIYGEDYDTPDGTCIRDYIHVSDLAAAHVLALARLETGGASFIFNCGYGRGASVREVIEAIERAAGCALPVVSAPRRAGDPPSLVARADRIRDALGWRPAHDDLDLIARTALAWERKLRSSNESTPARSGRVPESANATRNS